MLSEARVIRKDCVPENMNIGSDFFKLGLYTVSQKVPVT